MKDPNSPDSNPPRPNPPRTDPPSTNPPSPNPPSPNLPRPNPPLASPTVAGLQLDPETRCIHWHSPLDIIAIKMKCCGTYYACKDCHEALAGHPIETWPRDQWRQVAILCGACKHQLTIAEYMASGYACPACSAPFNPGCRKHYSFYFE